MLLEETSSVSPSKLAMSVSDNESNGDTTYVEDESR